MRADALLVARGLVPSRTVAQRLITAGHVFARASGGTRSALTRPGLDVADDVAIEIEPNPITRFVSRGGIKLDAALQRTGIAVTGARCLDVGQSTGGFTDCLLQRGAARVVGVDVGHDQLHQSLRDDPRVTCLEGVNARALSRELLASLGVSVPMPFDLIVADVSFISLTKVLPTWPPLLRPGGAVLALVKPQFEAGPEAIGRGGIVRDAAAWQHVEQIIRTACAEANLHVRDYFASSIAGGDGNREFFVHATT
ncbi:MAG: TlyA family RNA methyltransferase [Burkholderiales bacterium]|nr:TlyA family RNA methyltransferase [Burkholderiales bacterium]